MTKEIEPKEVSDVKIFEHPEFGSIRAMELNGEPWFVGKDSAEMLGYVETAKAIRKYVDSEDKGVAILDTPGGKQRTTIINESGLYSLILSSKLPQAKATKRWITSEVMPSIRKHGGYIAGQETMDDEELLARAFAVAMSKIKEKDGIISELSSKIEVDAPKVKLAESIIRVDGSVLSGDMPRILQQHGIQYSVRKLYEKLRDWGFFEYRGNKQNVATQRAIEHGLAIVEEKPYTPNKFCVGINYKTYITVKGQKWIIERIKKEEAA